MAPKKTMLDKKYLLGALPFKSCVSKIAGIDIDEYEDYEIARDLIGIYKTKEAISDSESVIFLDFDGVVVDSAKEAYAIAMLASGLINKLSELDLESEHAKTFLQQRCYIGPAWNYYYLLRAIEDGDVEFFSELLPDQAGKEARSFQDNFFATRQVIRNNFWDEWLDLNALYSGSEIFIDVINNNPNIIVVTTKDAATVEALLVKYGVIRKVDIFDNKTYEEFGCKSFFIDDFIKKHKIKRSLFIDDSIKHLNKCGWIEGLQTVQAKWGYVPVEDFEDNKSTVYGLILSVLRGGD